MSDELLEPIPPMDITGDVEDSSSDPFEVTDTKSEDFKSIITVSPKKTSYVSDPMDGEEIGAELPYLEDIDQMPGIASTLEGSVAPLDTNSGRRIALKGLNQDVKEYTDDIKAGRLDRLDKGEISINTFNYDVDMVRIFGQYCASVDEMAGFWAVDKGTISKLLSDEESDFCKVYNKSKAMLHLSLKQAQIKGALGGSEKLLMHLGKVLLKQDVAEVSTVRITELPGDGIKRRGKITTLTQRIEEFND